MIICNVASKDLTNRPHVKICMHKHHMLIRVGSLYEQTADVTECKLLQRAKPSEKRNRKIMDSK